MSTSNHACVACPAGSSNLAGDDASGGNTSCDGLTCASNQHVANHTCRACAAGSTRAAGDDPSGADTACAATICVADQHVVGHVCVGCPAGTTNVPGNDASGANTTCTPTLCAADQRVVAHACVACAPGSTRASGDDATGNDTSCSPISCPVNQRVSNHACVACEVNTTNAAGDLATGGDTTCDAMLCAKDQRVFNHVCVACAPGTTNDAGDPIAGADTSCETISCGANERVSAHACVACAPGTTNAAGDDASGADTACDVTYCAENELVLNHACVPCRRTAIGTGLDASGPDSGCMFVGLRDPCAFDNGGCSELVYCEIIAGRVECIPNGGVPSGSRNFCPAYMSLINPDVTLGFIGDGITCTDVDECVVDPEYCPAIGKAGCVNMMGGSLCYDPDFEERPRVPCSWYNGGCAKFTTCTENPVGPPSCGICPSQAAPGIYPALEGVAPPFEAKNGREQEGVMGHCNNVNECLIGRGPCDPRAICRDEMPKTRAEAVTPGPNGTYGGFTCTCDSSTVEAHTFFGTELSELPNGYNTVVNGVRTSCTPL